MSTPDHRPTAKEIADFRNGIDRAIRDDGLKAQKDRRDQCLKNLHYYRLNGINLIPRREAETQADFDARPKRALPFTKRVIDVLCSKFYAPGPTRTVEDDPTATEWLESAYKDNLANSLWQMADRMSTLNGLAAFQVAATGDPEKPIRLHLWSGWNEVVPFELCGRAGEVGAVVTIDRYDSTTHYTYWTDDFYRTYRTEKMGDWAGSQIPRFVEEEDNPYKILPFAFVWYSLPVAGVESVIGLGSFLSELNAGIDVEMSDMASAVSHYHTPKGVVYDGATDWQPIDKKGEWMRVNSLPSDLERAPSPRLEYLQASLDITGGWNNIRGVIDSELEALGIPLTAYRMDSNTLPSGAALVAEQKPLIEYAQERREPFRRYENDLKTVCCVVAGNYYGDRSLIASAGRQLSLAWPPATINLPGPERDATDEASVEAGYESPVMVVMRRFGMNRDQAIQHLQQVADDHEELKEIMSDVTLVESTPGTKSREQKELESVQVEAAKAALRNGDGEEEEDEEDR